MANSWYSQFFERQEIIFCDFMRLYQLDSLRFLFLIVIFISHLDFLRESQISDIYDRFLCNPVMAVDYFFVLSGFGLYWSLHNKTFESGFISSIRFAINRIKKIYPLYVFSLIISIPGIIIFEQGDVFNVVVKLLLNLTLCQSLWGTTRLSHGINGVCWFISALFVCYIFAPVMCSYIRKFCTDKVRVMLNFLIALLLMLLLVKISACIKMGRPFFDDLSYGTPYVRVFFLFFGMLLARLVMETKAVKNMSWIELFVLVGCVFLFVFRNSLLTLLDGNVLVLRLIDVFAVMSCFVYAYGTGVISKFLARNQYLVKWGGTYGVFFYLLHYPARKFIYGLFNYLKVEQSLSIMVVEIVLIVILTIVLTVASKKVLAKLAR